MNPKAHVLVVDDESIARRTLKTILEYEGYEVTAVGSGEAALQELQRHEYDLMVLDLKMDGMGGMDVLERMDDQPQLRVIVLTAFGSLDTAIQAIRFHLSDYLLKPASPEEILASVRKALSEKPPVREAEQRQGASAREAPTMDAFGLIAVGQDMAIDFRRRRIQWKSGLVDLTPTEARLLEVLLKYHNQVVLHSDLVFMVHGYRVGTEEAAKILRPVMSRLRKKLDEVPGGPEWIQNVRGSGYLLEINPALEG